MGNLMNCRNKQSLRPPARWSWYIMSGMILILGLSCTTVPWGSPSLPARRVTAGEVDADTPGSDIRIALVEQAYALLGKNRLQVRGRSFTLDCTGVVLAAYWGAAIRATELPGSTATFLILIF